MDEDLDFFSSEFDRLADLFEDATTGDAAVFKARLDELADAVEAFPAALHRAVVAEAVTELVRANPVGDKRLWKANIDRARRGLPALPLDYRGGLSKKSWKVTANGVARANAFATLAAAKPGDVLGVENEQPYMERLNRGWSKQQPAGWVDRIINAVIARFQARTA